MLVSAALLIASSTASPAPFRRETPYACFAGTTCKERVVACFATADPCATQHPKVEPVKKPPTKRKK